MSSAVPADIRAVPDMDDELIHALGQVEELLLTLAAWEEEDAAQLPEPFARRAALEALEVVYDAVRPTQSLDESRPVPGRLLAPDGRYEHLPLRFVSISSAHLDVLEHAAQLLAAPADHGDLSDALGQHAEANSIPTGELAGRLSRAVSVLGMTWDNDVRAIWSVIGSHPNNADVVLTDAQEDAYGRVAERINALWSYGSGIDRFLY